MVFTFPSSCLNQACSLLVCMLSRVQGNVVLCPGTGGGGEGEFPGNEKMKQDAEAWGLGFYLGMQT